MKDFDELPIYIKADVILKQGILIDVISYNHHRMVLYQLDGSFYELQYDKSNNEIIQIKTANKNRLNLYCPTLSELKQGL